jgi:hypothetical protein
MSTTTVKDSPITCLSAAQLSGEACARCHRPASDGGAMVPLREKAGLECLGAYSTLFVCWPECREEAQR